LCGCRREAKKPKITPRELYRQGFNNGDTLKVSELRGGGRRIREWGFKRMGEKNFDPRLIQERGQEISVSKNQGGAGGEQRPWERRKNRDSTEQGTPGKR